MRPLAGLVSPKKQPTTPRPTVLSGAVSPKPSTPEVLKPPVMAGSVKPKGNKALLKKGAVAALFTTALIVLVKAFNKIRNNMNNKGNI